MKLKKNSAKQSKCLNFALELMIFIEVLHQLLVQLLRRFITITHNETFNAMIAHRYQTVANTLKVGFNLTKQKKNKIVSQ